TRGVDLARLGRGATVVRAAVVDELVLQVDVRVARGRDGEHTSVLRIPDRTLHGLPDRTLTRVVATVELPRVDEVAVVRDLHAVVGGPDEAAHRRLRIDESRVIDDLHRSDLHARGHTGDADTVDCGCDRARDVCAVAVRGRVPGGFGCVDDAAQAGRALVLRDLPDQVGMGAGDAAV